MVISAELTPILATLTQTGQISPKQQERLLQAWQAQPEQLGALGIEGQDCAAHIDQQIQLWPQAIARLTPFMRHPEATGLDLLWHLWLPLALKLIRTRHQQSQPLMQGIVGAQGAGKTTLTQILQRLLTGLGYPTLSLSIDDFYLTHAERQQLQQQDPRFSWRGPPGTHDLQLALHVLEQLRQGQPTAIPRFDKTAHHGAGDRQGLEPVGRYDIILFEGWFVGAQPLPQLPVLANAPTPICTASDYQFAQMINQRLGDYLPLWSTLQSLIVLDLADYQLSYQWRIQAEQANVAQGLGGMSAQQVTEFVTYFWQALHPLWFIKPLTQTSHTQPPVELVIEVLAEHQVGRIYRP